MKTFWVFVSLLSAASSQAKEVVWVTGANGTINSSAPEISSKPVVTSVNASTSSPNMLKKNTSLKANTKRSGADGNLPEYLVRRDFSRMQSTSAGTVLPSSNLKSELSSLKAGDEFVAVIDHSIIAFPDEKSPVIATVRSGALKGAKLIGESSLEPNTKRIFISFSTIQYGGKTFHLKATGLTEDKQNGFSGDYHSQEARLFAGDFISSTVAAYFDGLLPRQTNIFGNQTVDNSVDSALKKGASGGAMASAERFKEKLKKTPEFSELEGPTTVNVLTLSTALEN